MSFHLIIFRWLRKCWAIIDNYLGGGKHCFLDMFRTLFAHADWNSGTIGVNDQTSHSQLIAHFLMAASWWSNALPWFTMALLKSLHFQRLFMISIWWVLVFFGLFWSGDWFRLTTPSQHSSLEHLSHCRGTSMYSMIPGKSLWKIS